MGGNVQAGSGFVKPVSSKNDVVGFGVDDQSRGFDGASSNSEGNGFESSKGHDS